MAGSLNDDLRVEQEKAWHAHRLEGSKAVIQFALIAIRSIILINGAAVIAILTFVGNLWTKDGEIATATTRILGSAIGFFVTGVGFGLLTAFFAYLSQVTIFELRQPRPGTDPYIGTGFRIAALVAAFLGLVMFGIGSYKSLAAFEGRGQNVDSRIQE